MTSRNGCDCVPGRGSSRNKFLRSCVLGIGTNHLCRGNSASREGSLGLGRRWKRDGRKSPHTRQHCTEASTFSSIFFSIAIQSVLISMLTPQFVYSCDVALIYALIVYCWILVWMLLKVDSLAYQSFIIRLQVLLSSLSLLCHDVYYDGNITLSSVTLPFQILLHILSLFSTKR